MNGFESPYRRKMGAYRFSEPPTPPTPTSRKDVFMRVTIKIWLMAPRSRRHDLRRLQPRRAHDDGQHHRRDRVRDVGGRHRRVAAARSVVIPTYYLNQQWPIAVLNVVFDVLFCGQP